MHVIAGKAVCFGEALQPEFKQYGQQIIDNAKALAEVLLEGGLNLVSGGTDNHLLLVDVTPLGIGGKVAEQALERCGITVNKNMIPFDQRKPMDPSGDPRWNARPDDPRHGTRRNAADWASGCWTSLRHADDPETLSRIRAAVVEMCQQYPVPAWTRLCDRLTRLDSPATCLPPTRHLASGTLLRQEASRWPYREF